MKNLLRVARTGLELFGFFALVFVLAIGTFGQGTPFGNGRGAFRGPVYVPSVFQLIFGDNTSSDVALAKNGANVVGITGNIGGSGSVANTTVTPAGPFAWGTSASTSGGGTVTFKVAFTNVPVCFAVDQTTAAGLKVAPTASTIVWTGATTTDVVAWGCFGNPN